MFWSQHLTVEDSIVSWVQPWEIFTYIETKTSIIINSLKTLDHGWAWQNIEICETMQATYLVSNPGYNKKIKSIFEHTLCLTTQNLKDFSRKRQPKPCLANVTLERKFQLQHDKLNYCKVASINTSQLEACFRFYILLIKKKFGFSFSVLNFGSCSI